MFLYCSQKFLHDITYTTVMVYRLVTGATVARPEANSGANSNVTSVNNDVAAVKIKNRKENLQFLAIHSLSGSYLVFSRCADRVVAPFSGVFDSSAQIWCDLKNIEVKFTVEFMSTSVFFGCAYEK